MTLDQQVVSLCPLQQTPPARTMAESSLFGGFGAILGYIGAEAATPAVFERLLWPQRYTSGFHLSSAPWLALLMPMGGPLHKVALKCLDTAFDYGLFKGSYQGHMLGTYFFSQHGWEYTMHANSRAAESHTEPVRNSIWTRALSRIPMPVVAASSSTSPDLSQEKNIQLPAPRVCRAKFAVSHLTLTYASPLDRRSEIPLVQETVAALSIRMVLAFFTTEATAICLALVLALVYKDLWSLFFLAPLFLKLFSAVFSLRREPLRPCESAAASDEPMQDFEIHCPSSEGNFMLITGPPSVVLQFFRHYGHPIRNRFFEVIQIAVVVLYGCYFPIGLLCSICWMPIDIQYAWLSYQIYIVLAMHVIRYCSVGDSASTEEQVVRAFTKSGFPTEERSILFGQNREDPGLVKASLTITYKNRFLEGKRCLEDLLLRHPDV